MKTRTIIIIVLIVIATPIVARLASNKKQLDEKNKPAKTVTLKIPVKVAVAKNQLMVSQVIKTGSVAPFKEAKVLARLSGTLLNANYALGDHVSEGQVLAVTDTRIQQLELQKAESNAAKLRNDLDTYMELQRGSAATPEQVNNIRLDYSNAVNQAGQARKNLADAYIRAPTSGIISARQAEKGVFVNAGSEIATIVNLSKAKVQVNLTEMEVYQVGQGQKVKITTDVYPGMEFHGKVTFVSPQADQAHNYVVEIQFGNSQNTILRSGTFVYADFSKNASQELLVIPREALAESVRNAIVYVVEQGVARQRKITTGPEAGGMVAVRDGLKAGDQVIISGQIDLRDGSRVIISK
ncbi:efflux RND transporter periplasmic adaptor subunit [Mucilaginibacter aquariorum]|uniref:Efflux RND transporter periplasmic adaptor subunit n=1 Tax=Mucilaginibacter aquariorum TaxID=2967225 RepID=A0ABT1SXX4_9SPHI|nr:efflux RND transporter periplasmic adaptor subunit [Mucilaginibacter aquariorum]MCQ6957205.1 efflux RND transporter periplasmic adaptor subunit [Mucilaginibacter aquariorum]